MNHELSSVLNRIASATSVIRTRGEDAERAAAHGDNGERAERERALISRLAKIAGELEQAIA